MKSCLSSLTRLAILAVPFAVFGTTWWLCESVLGLSSPFPELLAVAALITLLGGAYWWLVAAQKKEDEIIAILDHPFFGQVNRKRDAWECTMPIKNLGPDIMVSSYEGNVPTCIQRETVNWLSKTIAFITAELDECLDGWIKSDSTLLPKPREFVFESLLLDPDQPNTFCLGFDIKKAELPWGFSVSYIDGTFDNFTDNH